MRKYVLCLVLILLALFPRTKILGASTEFWRLNSPEEFLQGKLRGTGISSEGKVSPTFSAGQVTLPARVLWGAATNREEILVGTSRPAALFLFDNYSDTQPEKLVQKQAVGFMALAATDGGLYAGLSSTGEIYTYDRETASARVVADLGDSLILSMVPDQHDQGLYVGTGNNGTIYHLNPDGELQVVARLENHAVMELCFFQGELYAGDENGTLYKIEPELEASVQPVYHFSQAEIRSLAANSEAIYVGLNKLSPDRKEQDKQQRSAQRAAQLKQKIQQELQSRSREDVPRRRLRSRSDSVSRRSPGGLPDELTKGRGAEASGLREKLRQAVRQSNQRDVQKMFDGRSGAGVVKFRPPDQMNILFTSSELTVFDLFVRRHKVYVAAGGEGRIYRFNADGSRTIFYSTDQSQVTGLIPVGEQLRLFTTANGGALYRRLPFNETSVTYRSPVLEAKLLSRWGQLEATKQGPVEFRTRSGLTETPDTFWNSWTGWRREAAFSVTSKPAKYLQFEARFKSRSAELENVELARRATNQRPQISSFEISPHPRRQLLFNGGSGQSKSQRNDSNGGRNLSALLQAAQQNSESSHRKVEWQAVDPDGDQLSARLYYRPLGLDEWNLLAGPEKLGAENSYKWTGSEFSDGRYKLKLVVTDRKANPPGRSYEASRIIGPVIVDNSQPEIRSFESTGRQLSFVAVDQISRIFTVRYRTIGGDWRQLRPTDGIYDEQSETVEFSVPETAGETRMVEILVVDAFGNRRLEKFEL